MIFGAAASSMASTLRPQIPLPFPEDDMVKRDFGKQGRTWTTGWLVLLLGLTFAVPAAAVQPTVKSVPWVATNALIPHDTWSGKSITLKGTSDVQGATIEYTWDFGDGTPVATGTVTDMYAIQAMHAYVGNMGDIFSARLTVQDTSTGESDSALYFVEIQDKTLQIEANVAIDEGLWFLHKQFRRYDSGGVAMGDWNNNPFAGNYYALAANAVNAFEANGHVESLVGDNDPYKETVARGLKFVFSGLTAPAIAPTALGNPEDYDGDGAADPGSNSLGIRVNQGSWHYQFGMVADAIIASGTPNAVTVTGPANVIGRTYKDIIQDMVDYAAYGQWEDATRGGGWTYSFGNGGDNSICQWVAIALIPAERNGWAQIAHFVKPKNPTWLHFSQASSGSFGYQSSGAIWGPYATTPSGMVQMDMDGIGRGDNGTPAAGMPSWDKAEKFIRDNFSLDSGSYASSIKEYYYGLFSFVKSMRLHQPPITMLRDYTGAKADIDWYNAQTSQGDEAEGVARTLINDQDKSGTGNQGRWVAPSTPTGEQRAFHTSWAVLMLSQTLFQSGGPVAVADAIPNPAVVGQTITLDGTASFHQDAARHIVGWQWDLDDDGTFDASGPFATTSFAALGNYPVTLRVTDDSVPALTDDTVVTVRVNTPPIAPTANAGGPYVFCPGQSWFLDGTGSINPDEGLHEPGLPGDTIQSYAWDLDGDGTFSDAMGSQPDVTAIFTAAGVGDYLIRLQVTDTTATSFPSSGMGDLSDTDSAQVSVKSANDAACAACIDDLRGRVKRGKVQLVWGDTGANHYNVYRATTSGGPYTFLATTTSRYSTYLDRAVVNGTTYYYVVRPAAANNAELCQSNEVKVTPTRLRRRRR